MVYRAVIFCRHNIIPTDNTTACDRFDSSADTNNINNIMYLTYRNIQISCIEKKVNKYELFNSFPSRTHHTIL